MDTCPVLSLPVLRINGAEGEEPVIGLDAKGRRDLKIKIDEIVNAARTAVIGEKVVKVRIVDGAEGQVSLNDAAVSALLAEETSRLRVRMIGPVLEVWTA